MSRTSCRQVLEDYKEVNFLSMFVHETKPPTGHGHIKLVPISKIEGKQFI